MSAGRSPQLDEIIIEGLSDGIPLRQLARIHGFGKSSFYEWCADDADLAGRIARAREIGFDALAEEALEIAEDGTNDWETRQREDGTEYEALNHEHVSRSKLRVETRLKLLAKWAPKKYGDKQEIDLNHGVQDGLAALLAEIDGKSKGLPNG